ncbi:MAG TPA: glycosyltransferase family 4 protein [Actinomycetes bacterium]
MTGEPRVLVCADSLHGGLGTIASAHVEALRAAGVTVRVLAGPPAHSGAEPWSLPPRTSALAAMVRAGREVRAAVRAFRPDAVHCHGARSGLAAATGLVGLGLSARVTVHTALPGSPTDALRWGPRGWSFLALPLVLRHPSAVAPTRLPGWRFNPVLSPAAVPGGPAATGEPASELLWIGRLDAPKRLDQFLDLADQLAERGLISAVRVVGTGSQQGLLDEYARRGRAQLAVEGFLDDPWAETSGSEIVAILSDSEAVPLVLQEAMARGHLIVASRLPGIQWLAQESVVYWDGASSTAQRIAGLAPADRDHLRAAACGTFARYSQRCPGVAALVEQTLSLAVSR